MVYVYIGLTFILLLKLELGYTGSLAKDTVTVNKDIFVKPTPDQLTDSADRVDVILNCTGSSTELRYYIYNRVIWTFISNGREVKLTEKFYPVNYETGLFSGPEARFSFYYDNPNEGFYTFVITITGVTRADDGVYRCSLTNGGTLLDSKEVKLTVLNPVESVSIEIHDAEHNIIASSKKAVTKNATQVNLTPGQYMVKCDASGSNPKPVMHLLLNDEKQHVSTTTMKDKNAVFTSYRGSFTVDSLKINAHNALQTLTCLANIPGDYYPSAETGLALMVDNPVITISGQGNGVVYLGDDVLLTCNVDSIFPSTLAWHNQTDLIKKTHGTNTLDLHIANISLNHSRIYTCTAHNNIGGITTRSVSLTVKEKTFPKTVTGSRSLSIVVPVIVGCTVVVVAAVIAIIVFVTYLQRRKNAQVEIKETKQRNADPERNDTDDANEVSARYKDGANDQREYESVDPVEREETNEREVTNEREETNSDDITVNLNTGAKFVRAKLDLKQASDNNGESRLKEQQEPTNVTLNVNTDQQQYESALPTTDREETHTYSKLGGDDGKTNLQSQGEVNLVLAELNLKQKLDNAVRKPLLIRDEPNNESHYAYAEEPVYLGLQQKLDTEETHYSKLATD